MTKFFELLFGFMTQFPFISLCVCGIISVTIIAVCALIFHRPSQTYLSSGYDDIDAEDTDMDIEDLEKEFNTPFHDFGKEEDF